MYKGPTSWQHRASSLYPRHPKADGNGACCLLRGACCGQPGGSARGYLGDPELTGALEFVPAVESPAEEAQHPQITPATEPPYPPALGQDVTSQPPAIRHGVPIGAAHKAPTPDQRQGGDRFEEEQAELQRDQQQKQEARVLQQDQEAVAVGIKSLGIARAEFHQRAAPAGVALVGTPWGWLA